MSESAANLRAQAAKCRRLSLNIGDRLARAALEELAIDLEKRAATIDWQARGRSNS